MALTLAIDLGTTNLKAGIVDTRGNIIAVEKSANTTIASEPGAAEHDPEVLKTQILHLFELLLAKVDREDVKFIVASTYHFGLILIGKDNKTLTPMSLLTDRRAQSTFNDFNEAFAGIDIYKRTGCPPLTQYVLPRLYYFSKHSPQLLQKAKRIVDSKSFLFEWLTGQFVTDASIANATQLFNIEQHNWDEQLLQKLSLKPEQMPVVEDGTTYSAPLKSDMATKLKLGSDVVVALGLFDGAALGVSLTGLEPGAAIVNVGTTAMFRTVDEKPAFDNDKNPKTQPYAVNKKLYFNGGAVNNAALPLDWLKNLVGDQELATKPLLKYTEQPPLFSLPYLTGERYCGAGPYASGVFFGLRREDSPRELAQSIMEGVTYSIRYIYETLNENNITVSKIKMGGGATAIPEWPQLFADVMRVPVEIPLIDEMALVGNAIIAFVIGGLFTNMSEARQQMTRTGRKIDPVPKYMAIHNQRYEFFKKLRQNIDMLFLEHGKIKWNA
ncbi:MAG: hypothetical protein KIT80_07800 [Chitinophagaceae bacterium]|nr:hypothetical protein [Chitinophagaceae bacterium]MCW5926797.1 hypothetical protein [Chitinophagaceae bacterium]